MTGSATTTTTEGHGRAPRLCLPPLPARRARFVPPEGACDCHVHVFGDQARFPYADDRSFTPEPGLDRAALGHLHRTLGLAKAVIVQTGIQSPDVLLDALRAEPERLRGVAVLRGDTSDWHLDELNEAGVRGIRINLYRRAGAPVYRGGADPDDLAALAPRIRRLGWHIQAWLDAEDLPRWAPTLRSYGLEVVVDHMGRITTDRGLDSPGFAHLREMVRRGEVWCKLSCADRISVAGAPYADALPYARALLDANRDRVVWGTDWPHVNYYDAVPDDAGLLDLVPSFATDPEDVDRLFVTNPRQLYGF